MDLPGELDVHPRNWKSFRIWEQLKATHGAITLPEHLARCEVFAENMATIENVVESAKANIMNRARKSASDDVDEDDEPDLDAEESERGS